MEFIKYHLRMTKFSLPSSIRVIDIVQILLIAVFVYYLMVWIKNTRAYTLLKGVMFVSIFLIIAAVLRMDTILWICQQLSVVAITGCADHLSAGTSPCAGTAWRKKDVFQSDFV